MLFRNNVMYKISGQNPSRNRAKLRQILQNTEFKYGKLMAELIIISLTLQMKVTLQALSFSLFGTGLGVNYGLVKAYILSYK